jgi:hypothetical protein
MAEAVDNEAGISTDTVKPIHSIAIRQDGAYVNVHF